MQFNGAELVYILQYWELKSFPSIQFSLLVTWTLGSQYILPRVPIIVIPFI